MLSLQLPLGHLISVPIGSVGLTPVMHQAWRAWLAVGAFHLNHWPARRWRWCCLIPEPTLTHFQLRAIDASRLLCTSEF